VFPDLDEVVVVGFMPRTGYGLELHARPGDPSQGCPFWSALRSFRAEELPLRWPCGPIGRAFRDLSRADHK